MTTHESTSTLLGVHLRARLAGRVSMPGDPTYDADRAAWNLAVDQRPLAVVVAASADDVLGTVQVARQAGVRVVPQATGHSAAPLGDLSGCVLLRTSELRGVRIDAASRTVRVDAGALWDDVVEPAAAQGLAVLHGSARDVGVVGYTLGGGLGWYARHRGTAARSLTAADVVTGGGELVRADASQHSELLWALRGGGAPGVIVTALEFAAHPAVDPVAGWLVWPWEEASRVLRAWRAWTDELPRTVTSVGRLLQLPPLPAVPEPLRGRQLVVVEAAIFEPAERADALLAPLRALAPELDLFGPASPASLVDLHRDPPSAVPFAADHAVLDRLDDAAIDALVGVAGAGTGSRLLSVELRHIDGAATERDPQHGARTWVDGRYVAHAVGVAPDAEAEAAVVAQAAQVMTALEPWRSPVGYMNFAERAGETVLDEVTQARVARLAGRLDPAGVIRTGRGAEVAR